MPGISDHDIVFMVLSTQIKQLKQTPKECADIQQGKLGKFFKKVVNNLPHTLQEKDNTHIVNEL